MGSHIGLSGSGKAYDHAPAECFFRMLKSEEVSLIFRRFEGFDSPACRAVVLIHSCGCSGCLSRRLCEKKREPHERMPLSGQFLEVDLTPDEVLRGGPIADKAPIEVLGIRAEFENESAELD